MFERIFGAAAAFALMVAAFVALTMEHHGKGKDAVRPAASEFGFAAPADSTIRE